MGGEEIRPRGEDPERFHGSDVAVLKVDEPTRNVSVGDSGNYLFQVHGLSAYTHVGEDSTGHGDPQPVVGADEVGQVQLRAGDGPVVVCVHYDDRSSSE